MTSKPKKNTGQEEMGKNCYLNNNCWLVSNLKYSPYKRCQYCELKFRKCLFLQYQIVSFILICFSFSIILLFDKTISIPITVSILTPIIVYGYFFNISTEKIIKAHFLEKKARNELKEFSDHLEEKVQKQTANIRRKNARLEELLNVKNDFLRTVNHQLNTPLSIMKGAFSMMEDKSISTEKGMKIATHGLERMSDTMSDFWDALESEEQKVPVVLGETDIERVIKDMVAEKKKMELATERQLKIRIIKPDFAIPKVLCDQKIGHAISNLLDNAVSYTQEGSIKIHFEKIKKDNKKYLKVYISDTGEGIPQEDQKKLFQKFSRGSTTSSSNPNGSGLGLYIAKNIIENSGGNLRLESSKVGEGTTFSFILRVAKQ